MKAQSTGRASPSLRHAADLCIAGAAGLLATMALVHVADGDSLATAASSSWSGVLILGTCLLARRRLRSIRTHWYWLAVCVGVPMIIGAGGLAAAFGVRIGFPLTGTWYADGILWLSFLFFVVAEVFLLLPSTRAAIAALET